MSACEPLSSHCGRGRRHYHADMEAREAARRTFTGDALRRSLIIAIDVGTALNLINQGPELLAGDWPVVWKLVLTYLVPFLVASYGGYAAFRS